MTQYWFRPKRYGYGATPSTWEGWTATFASVIVLVVSIGAMESLVGPANLVGWLIWVVLMATATWWFIRFSRQRTDGEWRWRWGESDKR